MANLAGKSQRLSLYNNSLNLAMGVLHRLYRYFPYIVGSLPIQVYKTPFPLCLAQPFLIYSVFPIVKITLFCLYISFFFCILPRLQCFPYIYRRIPYIQGIMPSLPRICVFPYIYRKQTFFSFSPRIYVCFLYIGETILFYIQMSFLCFAQGLSVSYIYSILPRNIVFLYMDNILYIVQISPIYIETLCIFLYRHLFFFCFAQTSYIYAYRIFPYIQNKHLFFFFILPRNVYFPYIGILLYFYI